MAGLLPISFIQKTYCLSIYTGYSIVADALNVVRSNVGILIVKVNSPVQEYIISQPAFVMIETANPGKSVAGDIDKR